MKPPGNLFDDALPPEKGERFDVLLARRNMVIERIVSSNDITPTTYTQPQDEWVVVIEGEARLSVAGSTHTLRRGDHLFLQAGVPHTVEQTANGTVWLAVHLHA